MEQKRKRGRPRKVKLPEEITTLIDNVEKALKQIIPQVLEILSDTTVWDVPITEEIKYFDPNLSYELTGYKPINATKGLDFDPNWFTVDRLNYQTTGHYTDALYGSKAFATFWDTQFDRCRNGMESHGYKITGDHYFFLNFYQLPNLNTNKAGTGRAVDFPDFYVALYEWFHYLEMCKVLRKNAALMKARGLGFSEMNASLAANMYTVRNNSRTVITAKIAKYVEDTLSKVWQALSFLNDCTDDGFSQLALVINNSLARKASYIENRNGLKIEAGSLAMIKGITADSPNKIRGDRTDLLLYEEGGCHIAGTKVVMYNRTLKNVEDIVIGDVLMGPDGTERIVSELHSGLDLMYKITMDNKEYLIVNSNHIIVGQKYNYAKKTFTPFEIKAKDFYNMVQSSPRSKDGYKLVKTTLSFKKQDVPIDPYLFGFWLGDRNANSPRFTSKDPEIIKYLENYAYENNFNISKSECPNSKGCYHIYLSKKNQYRNAFTENLRQLNVLNNKHIPDCYIYNDRKTLLQVLAGIIDSNGCYNKSKHEIEITQYKDHKAIIDGAAFICRCLGLKIVLSTIHLKERILNGKIIKGDTLLYKLRILSGHSEIPVKIPRKKTTERSENGKGSINKLMYSFKIEKTNIDTYYGFTVNKDNLFILDDFTICHNSWSDSTKAFIQGDALIHILGKQFGYKIIGGTGGDSGNALEGLRTIFYNPDAFNVLPYKHKYSQTNEYVLTGYFLPAFSIVRGDLYMDRRGYTNPIKGKEYYDKQRIKFAKSPKDLITYCAEYCYCPEEAFNLEGDNKFNKSNIALQLTEIRALKRCPEIESGYIEYIYKDGRHIEQNITGFRWIPNLNSKLKILEHPLWTLLEKRDENNKVIWAPPSDKIDNLYVIGIDGIDIGKSQTSEYTKDPSDFCLVVYKRAYGLQEPLFVAIYKDRPNDIREAYKIAIKLAQYYNAVINIEATRLSIIPYARERKLLKLFMRRPRATLGDSVRNTNKQFGTPATPAIIDHQTDLIANYIEDYCYTIWFDEMLDEFNRYTDENKRKFDIVAAVAMALLADEELQGIVPKNINKEVDTWSDIGYYTDENGVKRYGVIPKKNSLILFNNNFGLFYDDNRIRTSDTRLLSGYL